MKVDQATFGHGKGGHSLLQSSGNHAVFSELVRRMDLPNTAPHGVSWSPYLSGFTWKDYYVLSRTETDSGATRGGVVFTRALLLPLDAIAEISNLGPFVSYLHEAGNDKGQVFEAEIDETEAGGVQQAAPLIALTNVLSSRDAKPAVWVGKEGFDEALIALWAVLWPELRKSLVFRLSFGPDDLIEKPTPNLVLAPRGFTAKWADVTTINQSSVDVQPTHLTTALLDPELTQQLRRGAEDFGLRINGFQDLFLVQQLLRATDRDDFISNLSAMRIIESLSESAEAGQVGKGKLLSKMTAQVLEVEASQVLMLRNLQMTKVGHNGELWEGLSAWITANHFPSSQDAAFLVVIRDALAEAASIKAWSSALKKGLLEAASQSSEIFSAAVWRWVVADASTGRALLSFLPGDSTLQESLLNTIPPALTKTAGLSVISVFKEKGWLRLHGAVLNRIYDVREAIRLQIAADTNLSNSEGLQLAVGTASDHDVVEAAITNSDERLIDLAAIRVAGDGQSLQRSDFSLYTVQRIWAAAILLSRESWKVPHSPREAAALVFDQLIDGSGCFGPLIDAVARTPLSDVAGYGKRSLLWEKLDPAQRSFFLENTARNLIQQLAMGGSLESLEPVLEGVILESEYTYERLIDAIVIKPEVLNAVADGFPSFQENHFERLLNRLVKRVPSVPMSLSLLLGSWARQRGWHRAASWMLSQMLSGRSDLRPALAQCAELFSWFIRLRHHLSTVSNDQKWAALREVSSTLYSSGPDHHDIWERSGGKNRELEHHGDGESRWTAALNRIRNGNGIHPGRLLHEMRQEYPYNEELRFLSEDVEFGGWRR